MTRVLKLKVLCADEQLLKRHQTTAYEVMEERQVPANERPW